MSTVDAQDREVDTGFILSPDELEAHAQAAEDQCDGLVVRGDPKMLSLLEEVVLQGRSDVVTTLQGESGTGKELFAKLVHHTRTPGKPYVTVNMASIEDGLIASELFGHAKGAYTSAIGERVGRFSQAGEGTLFLDEIGDMPPSKQPALLRVLEQGTFSPVGSNKEIKHEATVVCATNKDIHHEQEIGRMREDLYHRLRACLLVIPPFRERARDHQILVVRSLIGRLGKKLRRPSLRIDEAAMGLLLDFPIEGNVRGIEHVIHNAARYAEYKGTECIGAEEMRRALEQERRPQEHSSAEADPLSPLVDKAMEEGLSSVIVPMKRKIALAVLARLEGNRSAAARALGITRMTLINIINE